MSNEAADMISRYREIDTEDSGWFCDVCASELIADNLLDPEVIEDFTDRTHIDSKKCSNAGCLNVICAHCDFINIKNGDTEQECYNCHHLLEY